MPLLSTRLWPADASCNISQRIGRIGDHEQKRIRRGGDDTGNDVSVDSRIRPEQPEPPRRIIRGRWRRPAFSFAPAVIITKAGAAQIVVVPGAERHVRARAPLHTAGRQRRHVLAHGYDSRATISRADPRSARANMHAVPTFPAPTMPTFMRLTLEKITATHVGDQPDRSRNAAPTR